MFPELLSQAIIETLADEFDPQRNGVAIEIGVGTDNFYAVQYRQAGLKCIAVDPIAHPPFLEIARQYDIQFEEACIYDHETELTLFSNSLTDLSSLNSDWWGVDTNNQKKVKAILLSTLLNKYQIEKITFLKADTEGSEYEILKQLKDVQQTLLPAVVEFEYGGGGIKENGAGGWQQKYFDKVIATINLLKALGYQQALIIDSTAATPSLINLQEVTDADILFAPTFEYGNFLAFKQPIKQQDKFENLLFKTLLPYLERTISELNVYNTNLKLKVLKLQYFTRAVNKLKRMFGKS